ncbi:MAG: hypothetical protein WA063_06110 [Minisyncoccia bacterium]
MSNKFKAFKHQTQPTHFSTFKPDLIFDLYAKIQIVELLMKFLADYCRR